MAGGAIVNTAGGKDYPGKMTLFVFLTCLVAATGGLIFGYDLGISGTLALIKIQSFSYEFLGLFSCMGYVILSCFVCCRWCDVHEFVSEEIFPFSLP